MIELRTLGPEWIGDVRSLWTEAGLSIRPDGRDAPEAMTRELEETGSFLLGAFDSEELIGVILGTDDGRKGWLNRLAVKPSHRRRGVARALVRRCEKIFKERGRGMVAGLIEEGNFASFALYDALGYGTRRDIVYLRKMFDPSW